MKSYLSGCRRRVRLNNVFSEWKPITAGVPQGYLLGPLPFNIFINDFNDFITTVFLGLYADDTIDTVKTQALVIGTNSYNQSTNLGWAILLWK